MVAKKPAKKVIKPTAPKIVTKEEKTLKDVAGLYNVAFDEVIKWDDILNGKTKFAKLEKVIASAPAKQIEFWNKQVQKPIFVTAERSQNQHIAVTVNHYRLTLIRGKLYFLPKQLAEILEAQLNVRQTQKAKAEAIAREKGINPDVVLVADEQ